MALLDSRAQRAASVTPAIAGCLDACRRCEILVDVVEAAESPGARRVYAAIGPHLRHCVDHFDCLLDGLDSGVVDYDAREREQALEIDRQRMSDRLGSLAAGLRAIDRAQLGQALRVRQTAAAGAAPVEVTSNLERELVFLSGHTIHHIAIMAVLVRDRGIAIPEGLDMAFSTAAHMNAVDAESP